MIVRNFSKLVVFENPSSNVITAMKAVAMAATPWVVEIEFLAVFDHSNLVAQQ